VVRVLHERDGLVGRRIVRKKKHGRGSMRAKKKAGVIGVIAIRRSMPRLKPPSRYRAHHWQQRQRTQGACEEVRIQEPVPVSECPEGWPGRSANQIKYCHQYIARRPNRRENVPD